MAATATAIPANETAAAAPLLEVLVGRGGLLVLTVVGLVALAPEVASALGLRRFETRTEAARTKQA